MARPVALLATVLLCSTSASAQPAPASDEAPAAPD